MSSNSHSVIVSSACMENDMGLLMGSRKGIELLHISCLGYPMKNTFFMDKNAV